MAIDLENADLAANNGIQHEPDETIQHPPIATMQDGELEIQESDKISIRSHSTVATIPAELDQHTRSKSNTPSTRSRTPTIIPRSQRRGLFGKFTLVPEIENSKEHKRSTKWFITALVALAAAAAPMGSAIFLRKYGIMSIK
jgi:hypothetical protein